MTPLVLAFAVATVALVSTLLWAIAARQTAVYVTSGMSFVSWSWLGIVGSDVALVTETQTIWLRPSMASIQFIAVAMAIVSLVVFSLRLFGAYPSPSTNAAEADEKADQTETR